VTKVREVSEACMRRPR